MFFTQTDIQLLDAVLRVIALLCQLYINMGILVQDVKNHYSDAYQYECTRRLGVSIIAGVTHIAGVRSRIDVSFVLIGYCVLRI